MLSVGTGDLLLLAPAQGSPLAVTRLRLGNAGSWPRVQTPLGAGVAGGRGDHDNTAPSRSGGRSAPRSGSELLPLASGFRSAASATTAARVRRPRGPRGQRVVTGPGTSICAPAGPPSRARRRAAPFSAVLPPPRGSAERLPGLGRARGPRPRAGPAPAASADAALAGGHRGPPPSGTCEEGVRPSLHAREHSLHKLHLFAPEHSPAAPAAPARTPR